MRAHGQWQEIKKDKYLDRNASINDKDFFGTVYDGMMQSQAYRSLSIGARQFYVLCRVQAQSTHGTASLYQHGQRYNREYNKNVDFVFPEKHLMLYGMKRQNAHRYFIELVNSGFITIREQNQKQKMPNVYSFSDKWKISS